MERAKRFDSVIFDLDGTLWDATEVTAAAWAEVLRRHPDVKPAVYPDLNAIRLYMGRTCEEMARILFPDLPFSEAFALMEESCAFENEWLPVRGGKLWPGVPETLAELKKKGYRLSVVSNCQEGYIEAFLDAHRFRDLFEDFESSGRTGHGKADNIREVIRRGALSSPVYVGDTCLDADGAHAAGIPFVYCRYGFGETFGRQKARRFEYAADRFRDLPSVLESDPCASCPSDSFGTTAAPDGDN